MVIPALILWLGMFASASAAERFITLASTTSTQASGLFDYLLPKFTEKTGVEVRVVAVGTGQALKLGEKGDADALLVHDPAGEERFVKQGYGVDRRLVMYNDFVIVGPAADPAHIKGGRDAVAAFKAIAQAKATFLSRGDDSGTHRQELRLWEVAGIDVKSASGTWYKELGAGMGAALNTAAGLDGYTLSDRATWLSFKNRARLMLLVEGDAKLYNQYSVILVNPDRHPSVKADDARGFMDWLTSPAGQQAIGSFTVEGQTLFHPNAPGGGPVSGCGYTKRFRAGERDMAKATKRSRPGRRLERRCEARFPLRRPALLAALGLASWASAGAAAFPPPLNLSDLDGTNGFRLSGVAPSDRSGGAVSSAGDVNGDGLADLLIGANGADPNGTDSGASYVVFGRNTAQPGPFPATLNLCILDGTNGFRVNGVAAFDFSGIAVSSAGDVNGDGLADFLIGADGAGVNGSYSGAIYVVFGRDTAQTGPFPASLNLSSLDGTNGFRWAAVAGRDSSGRAVSSAGDVNGDGLADLLIGASRADPSGRYSVPSYVIFGTRTNSISYANSIRCQNQLPSPWKREGEGGG